MNNIEKLAQCREQFLIYPIVITVKRDKSIKLALESKLLNKAVHKNKYQMPNFDCLMDSISQQISSPSTEGPAWFSTLEIKHTYSQIPLHRDTAKPCNFNIVGGDPTGTTRFLTGFYGLTDMTAEFQKALDNTLFGTTNKYCFLDDILIVSKGTIETHMKSKYKCLEKFDKENFSVNLKQVTLLNLRFIG